MSKLTRIVLPNDVSFEDLKLARDSDGAVSVEWAVIKKICKVSNLPIEVFTDAPEDNLAALVMAWYRAHKEQGGAPDPVAEELIIEAELEGRSEQHTTHAPGRA